MTIEALPTLKEELNRKVTDQLIELAQSVNAHQKSEVAAAARAIWFAVAGLVDADVLDMAGQLAESAKPALMKCHFVGHGKVVSIVWRPTTNGYVVQYRNAADNTVSSRPFPGEIGVRDAEISDLKARLIHAGYQQLS